MDPRRRLVSRTALALVLLVTCAGALLADRLLGGIRIDSGDLDSWATRARALLDARGATSTRIIVSGDLDEHAIAALADAPVDGFGVGTRLVTGAGAPTANLVYKLVARSDQPGEAPDVPVAKSSGDKSTTPGRMRATRRHDEDGVAVAEVLTPWHAPRPEGRAVQVKVVHEGWQVHNEDDATIRDRVQRSLRALPADGRRLDDGPGAVPTERPGTATTSTTEGQP
jgi:nicotinate phosphoribosyltransferase